MGHVGYDAEKVRTLSEPFVVVQRVGGGGSGRKELTEGRKPEPMPRLAFDRPTAEAAAVHGAVDVASGPVAGGINDLNAALVRAGSDDEPEEAYGSEPRGVLGSVAVRDVEAKSSTDEAKLEGLYEVLSTPSLTRSIDIAVALARVLGMAAEIADKDFIAKANLFLRLEVEILRVAEANGMDEATARSSGLLPDFLEGRD